MNRLITVACVLGIALLSYIQDRAAYNQVKDELREELKKDKE